MSVFFSTPRVDRTIQIAAVYVFDDDKKKYYFHQRENTLSPKARSAPSAHNGRPLWIGPRPSSTFGFETVKYVFSTPTGVEYQTISIVGPCTCRYLGCRKHHSHRLRTVISSTIRGRKNTRFRRSCAERYRSSTLNTGDGHAAKGKSEEVGPLLNLPLPAAVPQTPNERSCPAA